jgi:aminopeptidase S
MSPLSSLRPSRSCPGLVLAGIALVAVAGCGSASGEAPGSSGVSAPTVEAPRSSGVSAPTVEAPLVHRLAGEVDEAGAMQHLQALQKIADEHGGNRAAGTSGYDASVDYVVGVLQRSGFEVSTPAFEVSGEHHEAGPGTDRNVIAQTRTGDPDRVVMVGAHLDSVRKGPGIVDNGSGVASLLEIATRLGTQPSVRNAVRFSFFGAEESGAEGSTAYVKSLSADELKKVKLYLNVDMVASPNAGYFVQGGKGSNDKTAGPRGSAVIGRVLADQLARTGVAPAFIEFVGDDESPFIEADIPVGGAENGDAEKKTNELAQAWGGQAGEPYDRCYHQACDRIENVNRDVLNHYLRAIAGTVANFATSTATLR